MKLQSHLMDGADKLLLAHIPKSEQQKQPETLVEHSELVMQYADKLKAVNGLGDAIHRTIGQLHVDGIALEAEAQADLAFLFDQAIYLHDLGKVNPEFQRRKMRSKQLAAGLRTDGNTRHALLSALLYLHIFIPYIEEKSYSPNRRRSKDMKGFMKHALYMFAYVISRHHTYLTHDEELGELTRFEKELRELQKGLQRFPDYLHYYKGKDSLLRQKEGDEEFPYVYELVCKSRNERLAGLHPPFPFYVLIKLLYSTLVACDFYAAHEYESGTELPFRYFGAEHPLEPVLEQYRQTAVFNTIQQFRLDPDDPAMTPMNRLRSALFVETEEQLLRHITGRLFYLEGPTGSGKTNMSLNTMLQLLNSGQGLNKLLYAFPFNTLIEQTKDTLDGIFSDELQKQYRMAVVNSVTPIATERELAQASEGEGDPDWSTAYKIELMQRQMLQYPVTLTSHVNFFRYLFGTGRESNLAFVHLCNSVVVLDEIQSYRNGIWKEMIHFLHIFAETMNMRIIIMSATLPRLELLLEDSSAVVRPLVADRSRYFQHPLFRDRVQLHFEWLERKQAMELEELLGLVQDVLRRRKEQGKSTRTLIEFITKPSASEFYKLLCEKWDEDSSGPRPPIYELTGDDGPLQRKEVLSRLSGKQEDGSFRERDAIVVATQVIEAGVDMDMDIGFKDISLLDSEEQFLGRINRSCLRDDCHAYFFHMIDATRVYRGDMRADQNVMNPDYQRMLRDKDFSAFYARCLQHMNESRERNDGNNWTNFASVVQELNFPKIEECMRLIEDRTYTLFLNYELSVKQEGGETTVLQGETVWQEFLELIEDRKNMDYAEHAVKLSQMWARMAPFLFSYGVRTKNPMDRPAVGESFFGGSLYYVADGAGFVTDDPITGMKKFNRSALKEKELSLFI